MVEVDPGMDARRYGMKLRPARIDASEVPGDEDSAEQAGEVQPLPGCGSETTIIDQTGETDG